MSRIIFRPIDQWPGQLRPEYHRKPHPFGANWSETQSLLRAEVDRVARRRDGDIVLQVAADERAMRLDGGLRADAKPAHPGVIISFESKYGPLRYHTDVFTGSAWQSMAGWQANVRAVALGLESLRRVDRYGITKDGEQYRGWNSLPPAREACPAMTVDEAARLLIAEGEWGGQTGDPADLIADASIARSYFREAAKRHHPDAGGDAAMFRRLSEARDLLVAVAS